MRLALGWLDGLSKEQVYMMFTGVLMLQCMGKSKFYLAGSCRERLIQPSFVGVKKRRKSRLV